MDSRLDNLDVMLTSQYQEMRSMDDFIEKMLARQRQLRGRGGAGPAGGAGPPAAGSDAPPAARSRSLKTQRKRGGAKKNQRSKSQPK